MTLFRILTQRICEVCQESFIPVGRRQRYCGSSAEKYGCAYEMMLRKHREWRQLNKQRSKEIIDDWRARHPERLRLYGKKYNSNNKDKRAAWARQWRRKNPEKHSANYKRWAKQHPDKIRRIHGTRRAAKLNAEPPWVDRDALRSIYERAVSLGLHVDHIIPLKHPMICGLHVPWNLQLLTKEENLRKGNRWVQR